VARGLVAGFEVFRFEVLRGGLKGFEVETGLGDRTLLRGFL